MRISDWSSDVCSSDLVAFDRQVAQAGLLQHHRGAAGDRDADLAGTDGAACGLDADDGAVLADEAGDLAVLDAVDALAVGAVGIAPGARQLGSASGRESVCQYV